MGVGAREESLSVRSPKIRLLCRLPLSFNKILPSDSRRFSSECKQFQSEQKKKKKSRVNKKDAIKCVIELSATLFQLFYRLQLLVVHVQWNPALRTPV